MRAEWERQLVLTISEHGAIDLEIVIGLDVVKRSTIRPQNASLPKVVGPKVIEALQLMQEIDAP